jgi:hypothetical protein
MRFLPVPATEKTVRFFPHSCSTKFFIAVLFSNLQGSLFKIINTQ